MEMLIAVAVVAIITAVALPSYLDSVRKSRRAEAMSALSAVQQAQERWRANKPEYAKNDELTKAVNGTPPGLGLSATTSSGYYAIALNSTSATAYTAVATAVAGTSQANDANCKVMAVRMKVGNIEYGAWATSPEFSATTTFTDSSRCWVRQ